MRPSGRPAEEQVEAEIPALQESAAPETGGGGSQWCDRLPPGAGGPGNGVTRDAREGVPTMAKSRGYSTVYWGTLPVNFRPQDFPKPEVEAAIGYAEGSFRNVSGLVPDFSVLTLGAGPGGTSRPRSCWATRGRRGSCGAAGFGTLPA